MLELLLVSWVVVSRDGLNIPTIYYITKLQQKIFILAWQLLNLDKRVGLCTVTLKVPQGQVSGRICQSSGWF